MGNLTARAHPKEQMLAARLQLAARVIATLIMAGGGLVLLGWYLDVRALQAIGPVDVVMNPLAAALFVLTGSALLADGGARGRGAVRIWRLATGLLVSVAGGLVLLRTFGWQVPVDELLFGEQVRSVSPPDWMAENTALSFFLLGLALLTRRERSQRPAVWFVLPVALMSLLVVIGYIYHATGFITFQLQLPMALNTALFLLSASFAVVVSHPVHGTTALLVRDSAGGRMTRRLLPALLLVPLVVGMLLSVPLRAGWYGPTVVLALFTLATMVLSVVLTVTTAGALHRSDQALRGSEEHFRALIENSSDCILIVDTQGEITYAAPSIERILGHRPEDVLGKQAGAVVHPDDLPKVRAALAAIFGTPGEVVQLEFRIRHSDGSWRVLESLARTLQPRGGQARAVVNARDITAHKDAAEALLRARAEADRANHAKSEFLSRMSHELRTPLNSILGFAQVLEMGDLTAAQARAVERIRRAGDHLLRLINEVLDLARIEANRESFSLEPVRVAGVLRETLDLIRPIAGRYDCRLSDAIPATADCFVTADRQRLSQVLLNLLTNAVKYNRPGGGVRILCRVRYGHDGEKRVAIGVVDDGPGIEPDRLHELFTPFARLGAEATAVEGTGLGLSLSRRLVEAMGGEIRVQSVREIGSTFWVELPLASAPAPAPPRRDAPERAAAGTFAVGAPTCILYVEDNRANLELMENIFAPAPGVRVIPVLQGRLALPLAREHRPSLILLDLHLADMSGEEVLAKLLAHEDTRSIPVVVVSADASPERVRQLLAAGAREYLTKPLDVPQLMEVVGRLVAAAPTASPSGARPLVDAGG